MWHAGLIHMRQAGLEWSSCHERRHSPDTGTSLVDFGHAYAQAFPSKSKTVVIPQEQKICTTLSYSCWDNQAVTDTLLHAMPITQPDSTFEQVQVRLV